jgi:hypothetical protein
MVGVKKIMPSSQTFGHPVAITRSYYCMMVKWYAGENLASPIAAIPDSFIIASQFQVSIKANAVCQD